MHQTVVGAFSKVKTFFFLFNILYKVVEGTGTGEGGAKIGLGSWAPWTLAPPLLLLLPYSGSPSLLPHPITLSLNRTYLQLDIAQTFPGVISGGNADLSDTVTWEWVQVSWQVYCVLQINIYSERTRLWSGERVDHGRRKFIFIRRSGGHPTPSLMLHFKGSIY